MNKHITYLFKYYRSPVTSIDVSESTTHILPKVFIMAHAGKHPVLCWWYEAAPQAFISAKNNQ